MKLPFPQTSGLYPELMKFQIGRKISVYFKGDSWLKCCAYWPQARGNQHWPQARKWRPRASKCRQSTVAATGQQASSKCRPGGTRPDQPSRVHQSLPQKEKSAFSRGKYQPGLANRINSSKIESSQIESNQLESKLNKIKPNRTHTKTNQIISNQLDSIHINSNRIKSNQTHSNPIKSNQTKSNRI